MSFRGIEERHVALLAKCKDIDTSLFEIGARWCSQHYPGLGGASYVIAISKSSWVSIPRREGSLQGCLS